MFVFCRPDQDGLTGPDQDRKDVETETENLVLPVLVFCNDHYNFQLK